MIHIGFTGGRLPATDDQRQWMTRVLSSLMVAEIDRMCLHHGDCVGKDAAAHEIASRIGYQIVIHPPAAPGLRAWCGIRPDGFTDPNVIDLRPSAPYDERNAAIVAASKALVAVPDRSRVFGGGTWMTIAMAERAKIRIFRYGETG